MYIFGRDTMAPHGRLGDLALECTHESEESLRAIGWNLLCDHRVSESRAAHFYEETGQPDTVDKLKKAMVDYHKEWVCTKPHDTYLSRRLNGHNFVSMSKLPKDLELANVLNVSSWLTKLRAKLPSLSQQLEGELRSLEQPETAITQIETFLDTLFAAINANRDGRPTWVARWKDFERSIERASVGTWNAAVGAWVRRGSWQIVLRYPLSTVTELIRPTQLDTGLNQYHFPSPPFPRATRGGFTMLLRELSQTTPLISEWIHSPIDLKVDYWTAAGRLCAEIQDNAVPRLRLFRSQHRERLARRFLTEVTGWLPAR
jgi:hypothetical protein